MPSPSDEMGTPRWLVTGAGGALGSVILRTLVRRGAHAVGTVSPSGPRPELGTTRVLDLGDLDALSELVRVVQPTHVVHAAAMASPAAALASPELARRINVEVSAELAVACQRLGARLLFVSSDMVFDGEAAPYGEGDAPTPLNLYGRTKAEAEARVLAHGGVVLRSPLLYGLPAAPRTTTFTRHLDGLRAGTPQRLFTDEYRTPLWLEDAADTALCVADSAVDGVLHAGGPERLSRLEMGQRVADALGLVTPAIELASRLDAGGPEPRARDVSLSSERFIRCFGRPPGRPMAEALAIMLAPDVSPSDRG